MTTMAIRINAARIAPVDICGLSSILIYNFSLLKYTR